MPNPKIFLAALAASFALVATAPAPVMAQSAKPKVKKAVAAKMANPAAADLPPLGETATYYQIGNRVISVDNESRVILNVIEVAGG